MNQTERTGAQPCRVAVYCRVSMELELQEGSFERQRAHYEQLIAANPAMTLVDVYGDKGKSGRSIHARAAFRRMLADCEAGKIDMILTKSLSRFARNMADCLTVVRRLRELRIPVVFEKEGINTMESSGELLLSIMASLAQEESNSIAENMRWSMDRSNARGEPFFRAAYGYTKCGTGRAWGIDADAARRVRCAFDMAAQGRYYREIIGALDAMECEAGTGVTWSRKRVAYMLRNVSYMGDCLTNRTFTVYTDRRLQLKNCGERDRYYIEGHHAPLVSRALFARVQRVMDSGLLHSGHKRRTPEQRALLAERTCGE